MKKITHLFFIFLLLGITGIKAQSTRNTLEFDGTMATSLVDCSSNSAFSQSIFTVEAWVKLKSNGGTIISNVEYENGGLGAKGFSIRLATDNKVEFVMGIGLTAGDWAILVSEEPLTLDKWTHVAVVYDGAVMNMYFDGVSKGILANTNAILTSNQKLFFGEHPTWSSRRFTGELSDVRIWNVARTEAEIASSMNDFLNNTESGLIANWKLDEGTGTVAADQVNSANGTIGEGTTWNTNTSLSTTNFFIENGLKVFPNPSKGSFNIEVNTQENLSFQVYSISGRIITKGIISQGNKMIDLTSLSKGVYFLRGDINKSSFVRKLIIN